MKEIKIKSNGLRNELKEIRKSLDKLTNAILATNKRTNEKVLYECSDPPIGVDYITGIDEEIRGFENLRRD